MKYNKLVRDKIPEIIEQKGVKAITHIANDKEFEQKLKEKLQEEINEFLEHSCENEIVDILEVIYAFCDLKGIDKTKLKEIAKEKNEKKGKFNKKIILDETKED